MSYNYYKGYLDAFTHLDEFITAKIKENGGAREMLQVLNVWNQTIAHLHAQKQHTQEMLNDVQLHCDTECEDEESDEYLEFDVEEDVEQFLEQLFSAFGSAQIQLIKMNASKEEF